MVTLPIDRRSCSDRLKNSWKERVCFGTISMIATDQSSCTPLPRGAIAIVPASPHPPTGLGGAGV